MSSAQTTALKWSFLSGCCLLLAFLRQLFLGSMTVWGALPFLPPVCYNARVSCAMRVGALLREDPSPSNHSISGYSEVGIALDLGAGRSHFKPENTVTAIP